MSDSHTHIEGASAVDLQHDRKKVSSLIDKILGLAESKGFGTSSLFAIRLAIEEGITNAFEHGHEGLDPSTPVHIEYAVSHNDIQIAIEDQGPGFSPDALPDPTLIENLSKPSGRGVMLMQAYMSEVHFNKAGNRVKLRYIRPS
jgi:serine/threonine-protein kinase RsbW